MATAQVPHWTDVLQLRDEVQASDGGVGELQMSLHKAVTKPATPLPAGRLLRRHHRTHSEPPWVLQPGRPPSAGGAEATALYHLDQGMGGGKSHALVGLYHTAGTPKRSSAPTSAGRSRTGKPPVTPSRPNRPASSPSPPTTSHPARCLETFGFATDLFGRFLWALFDGDRDLYDTYSAKKANKATLHGHSSTSTSPS